MKQDQESKGSVKIDMSKFNTTGWQLFVHRLQYWETKFQRLTQSQGQDFVSFNKNYLYFSNCRYNKSNSEY